MASDEERDAPLFSNKDRGVLYQGDRKFAVGLTWLTTEDDTSVTLLKERLEKLEADYYCIRTAIANQHGFGFIALGHRMSMIAGAAVAADMLVGDWHGVFTADNGWWYLAVHSDNIAPGGDRFFFSEEQAYSYFTEQASLYNWPRSYAPATWNIEDANPEIPLQKLLEDTTQAPVMRSVNLNAFFGGEKRRNFAFFVLIIVAFTLFSAAILPAVIAKEREKKEMAVRPAIMAPAIIKAPPKIDAIQNAGFSGNLKLPKPSVVMQYCNTGISRVMEPLPGWGLEAISCNILQDGKRVQTVAQWQRRVGSLEIVKKYLAQFGSDIQIEFDGQSKLQAYHTASTPENISTSLNRILTREEQIRVLYDRFGNIGKMKLSDVTPPPPDNTLATNVNRFANEKEILQKPPYLKMVLLTRTPPKILAPYFDVPGLKLQNVNWSIKGKDWTYTADILFESDVFNKYYSVVK